MDRPQSQMQLVEDREDRCCAKQKAKRLKISFVVMALLLVIVITTSLWLSLRKGSSTWSTPLDDYVNRPDSHYTYTHLTSFRGPNVTLHLLNMTSQKWLDELFSNRPIWWHYLTIIVPDNLNQIDSGFLYIDGGANTDDQPTIDDPILAKLLPVAVTSGTVVANLMQVPNQPIIFENDPSRMARKEDELIAFMWRTFMEKGSNSEVLPRLPMTKAAVRAMDTVSDFCQKTMNKTISRYVVAGASKRGWTTWTTAAVDKRVIGFAPVVMDLLNIQKNLHHIYRLFGGWTYQFYDYYLEDIMKNLDTENFTHMAAVVDPIVYNDRYASKPKCVISASGDSFFPPDGAHYYYDELKGPKYLRIVPNDDHSMKKHVTDVYAGVTAFYMEVINGTQLPSLRWERNQTPTGGEITLWTDRKPTSVTAFYAFTLNDKRRDFRLTRLDPSKTKAIPQDIKWFSKHVLTISDTRYRAMIAKPATGWAAFYIQVTFDGVTGETMTFTTSVNVIPDTFPFEDCQGIECHGTLV